jgi:hypothetical protein
MTAIRALLGGLIDYAGFAPPASLPFGEAARNYASYRTGPESWMLGRFVVPGATLAEFETVARGLAPFHLSVLANAAFAQPTVGSPHSIDAIEVKAGSSDEVAATMEAVPEGMTVYFEIPLSDGGEYLVGTIAKYQARTKVRTGGLTPDLIPASADLARLITACARARVPFKATAGLHHPIRSVHSLTNAPDSPKGVMHGFVNLFLASAWLYWGGTEKETIETLEETSPKAFRFEDEAASWHGHRLTTQQIVEARENFAIGFGSCSFEEPIADLRSLKFL